MRRGLLTLGLLLVSPMAYCWGDLGHMVVAAVAWKKLDHATKIQVAHVLMHGDVTSGTVNGIPFTHRDLVPPMTDAQLTDAVLDAQVQPVFIQAATWPDDIKGGHTLNFEGLVTQLNSRFSLNGVSGGERVRCKSWHYLDLPIVPAVGPAAQISTVMAGSTQNHPFPVSNAANAINQVLRREIAPIPANAPGGANPIAAKMFLLEHIVGDLHQPLHAVTFFGPGFASGDQGGNLIQFTERELHAYWDHGIDHAADSEHIPSLPRVQRAIAIAKKWLQASDGPQPSPSAIAMSDPMVWLGESRDVAVRVAYNGIHSGSQETTNYRSAQIRACKARALLGGCRLAVQLKALLTPHP